MQTSSPTPYSPDPSSGKGIMGEGRQLLSSISFHLLTLLKLAQWEGKEAYCRVIKKIILLVVSLVFLLGTYLALNAAGACYLQTIWNDWTLAFLILAGINFLVGIIFVLIGSIISVPLFKDTLTELENDLLWITEKYRAKQNSSNN